MDYSQLQCPYLKGATLEAPHGYELNHFEGDEANQSVAPRKVAPPSNRSLADSALYGKIQGSC